MGGGDVSPQCFVKDLLWVVNLVCKKEDSVYCWFKAHLTFYKILFALVKVKQSVQLVVCVLSKDCLAPTFVRAKQVKYVVLGGFCCCFFFLTDLKTSLYNFIPVHLTVVSPHYRRLSLYFWTFVCSNYDIFHLLGTNKCWCKTILAQNTHNNSEKRMFCQLSPCEATFKQHVLRVSLQTYVWYRAIL
jgi:predicted nucleic acid-binding Zn finger protein